MYAYAEDLFVPSGSSHARGKPRKVNVHVGTTERTKSRNLTPSYMFHAGE